MSPLHCLCPLLTVDIEPLRVRHVHPLCTLSVMDKDVGYRIRIDRRLRERFLEVCRSQDKPAAQVIREFMRDYVGEHDTAMFAGPSGGSRQGRGVRSETR